MEVLRPFNGGGELGSRSTCPSCLLKTSWVQTRLWVALPRSGYGRIRLAEDSYPSRAPATCVRFECPSLLVRKLEDVPVSLQLVGIAGLYAAVVFWCKQAASWELSKV